mgnify:CR=1 FL=1
MDTIYLDNAATTKPCEEAISAMVNAMQKTYANPSALHLLGLQSEDAVLAAKQTIAKALGTSSNNIYFTSGGTESDNWAIIGGAEYMSRRGKHIITSAVEHDAVRKSMEELERRLRGRGDTSEEQITMRLARSQWELEQSKKYDHIVINDQVDTCAEEILNIIAKKAD